MHFKSNPLSHTTCISNCNLLEYPATLLHLAVTAKNGLCCQERPLASVAGRAPTAGPFLTTPVQMGCLRHCESCDSIMNLPVYYYYIIHVYYFNIIYYFNTMVPLDPHVHLYVWYTTLAGAVNCHVHIILLVHFIIGSGFTSVRKKNALLQRTKEKCPPKAEY